MDLSRKHYTPQPRKNRELRHTVFHKRYYNLKLIAVMREADTINQRKQTSLFIDLCIKL